eukprot:CAMPEP_0204019976 /NCGR_PEP_ID=MMETSP0360-20130528/29115_1 /ASSEMBLY_ACC=CAM_ASM_000342 /TAXON_ID=268821 /ORGANISM="Scrippsiella Hangoei, Strain SHTV-5" /LENGTH=56 /DNA_ID=CAMNT_0050963247 /DNA_START=55 /DNA_END=222 /DNA_ORIENTATION=+
MAVDVVLHVGYACKSSRQHDPSIEALCVAMLVDVRHIVRQVLVQVVGNLDGHTAFH